jgi:hypothetical protein
MHDRTDRPGLRASHDQRPSRHRRAQQGGSARVLLELLDQCDAVCNLAASGPTQQQPAPKSRTVPACPERRCARFSGVHAWRSRGPMARSPARAPQRKASGHLRPGPGQRRPVVTITDGERVLRRRATRTAADRLLSVKPEAPRSPAAPVCAGARQVKAALRRGLRPGLDAGCAPASRAAAGGGAGKGGGTRLLAGPGGNGALRRCGAVS